MRLFTILFSLCFTVVLEASDLRIVNATLISGPGMPVLSEATIDVRGGRIVDATELGEKTLVVDAKGRVVTTGLWNSHIHLTAPEIRTKPNQVLREMLLKYGFTSVLDTGSDPETLSKIRTEIRAGQYKGPRILAAGGSFVYKDGTPSYLPGIRLPEVTSPAQATAMTHAVLTAGAEGIKVFSGSFQTPTETIWIPVEVIQAVTKAASLEDSFVVAHPTDRQGLENAIAGGVDILAHTAPPSGSWSEALVDNMVERQVALIPTLQLWRWELLRFGVPLAGALAYQQQGVAQLAKFHERGGTVLFGTDVGYMTEFNPAEEYQLLTAANLEFDDILASLTVNPATRLKTDTSGRVQADEPGDLVIYFADPRENSQNFSEVAMTIRAGVIVYQNEAF